MIWRISAFMINKFEMKTVTNNKHQVRPIQLLRFDANKKLVLTTEAVELFSKIQSEELSIVTVAGRYRTGKSYILNRVLLERNSGFEVGPTINACTKGLWIWPEVIKIKADQHIRECLIIDTEGLGSLQQGQNTDLKIFLMAMLLSSYFIYNSVGSIDEKAIQNLGLVTNLAQLLFKQGNSYDTQQLIHSFPAFMWLVRDFSLRLQDQSGQPITSQEYLENALKSQKVKVNVHVLVTQGSDHKNQIRKQLKTFFPDRNCFTLIRPTENEKDLQNLSTLPEKRLRPQFLNLIKSFKQKIHKAIKPKKVRGKSISPQGFIQICKYYVDMINSGKIPAINSHWDSLCVKEASRIIEAYRGNHFEILQNQIQDGKDPQNNLKSVQEMHSRRLKEACDKIDKSFLGKLEKQLSKERLGKFLSQIEEQVIREINDSRYAKVQDIVREIFDEIVIEFKDKNLQSFDQIFQRFEQVKYKYRHESRIYESFYENSRDVFQEFLRNLEAFYQREQLILLQKNQYLQIMIQKKTSEMKEKLTTLTERIREMEQKIYKKQLENEQIKRKNNEIQTKIQQLLHENAKFRDIVEEYEERLEDKKSRELQEEVAKNQSEIQKKLQQIQMLRIEGAKDEERIRQLSIRQRKLQRQTEIFKNKCSEYLKQNINLNEEIEKLNRTIFNYEQETRKKHLSQFKDKDSMQIVSTFNKQIDQLNFSLKSKENQISTLQKCLHDEKLTNETLLKTPQNLNFMALKKSYQLERQNNKKLQAKLEDYNRVFSLCSFVCSCCKKKIDKSLIRNHVKVCFESKTIEFDVSYQYNCNGEMEFVIDIRVDEAEWTVRKSIQSIRLMLTKMKVESKLFKDMSANDDLALSEDRRMFLDELFNRLQVWESVYLIQFFGLDIHYKNGKKQKKLSLELEPILEENIAINLMKTTKFNKKIFNFGPQM